MSLLKRAMEEARSEEEIAAACAIAALSEDPQEAAQTDHFSTDPLTGYDAAQIALRLFEGRRLEEFSGFLKEKNLTPNIVLPNGLTLLQNSLFRFPQDEDRLECLLGLGANPNLFMRRIEEEGFGSSTHRATYHPLNYAFANCPQLTTPEVCRVLRKYGASADGLRNYFEVDPVAAVPDDQAKATLRRELISIAPDLELTKNTRQDVDLSVMQKHLANIETQLAAAGFQVVNYAPSRKMKARAAEPDTMIPIFKNFKIRTRQEASSDWQMAPQGKEAKVLLGYQGGSKWQEACILIINDDSTDNIQLTLLAKLTASDPLDIFEWLPSGASANTVEQNQALAYLKPAKFIFINKVGQGAFGCSVVGVYKDKNDQQFFFDPSINGIRILSNDGQQISLADRSDILGSLTAKITTLEFVDDTKRGEIVSQKNEITVDPCNRPVTPTAGIGASQPRP